MAKHYVIENKEYLLVPAADRKVYGSCAGCALQLVSHCPKSAAGLLLCGFSSVFIKNTPEARAEHFARKVE